MNELRFITFFLSWTNCILSVTFYQLFLKDLSVIMYLIFNLCAFKRHLFEQKMGIYNSSWVNIYYSCLLAKWNTHHYICCCRPLSMDQRQQMWPRLTAKTCNKYCTGLKDVVQSPSFNIMVNLKLWVWECWFQYIQRSF